VLAVLVAATVLVAIGKLTGADWKTLCATEPAKKELAKKIETTSVTSRVVSSQATMLILDSDREYEKYGIDRRSLVDILVVGAHGLEQLHRSFVASRDRKAGRGKPGLNDYLLCADARQRREQVRQHPAVRDARSAAEEVRGEGLHGHRLSEQPVRWPGAGQRRRDRDILRGELRHLVPDHGEDRRQRRACGSRPGHRRS